MKIFTDFYFFLLAHVSGYLQQNDQHIS